MEDLAASLTPYPHSAPLYLLYDAASIANASHGLAAPPLPLLGVGDDDDDGFAFATTTTTTHNGGGGRALRACASDVSAAAFADELFCAGAPLPLSLPPRLQRPAYSAAASAATSPTSQHASCRSSRKHRGFDPFVAALEKVRRDGAGAPVIRRARSLSPLRGAAQTNGSGVDSSARKGRGVRHMLCRVLMASAPRALWPRRKHGVSCYRPGLLVCLGYGL